jgi:TRAP-type C4-dicarboxylate transport system substrate-binding protein
MQTRRVTQWMAAAVLAGMTLALAACSGSNGDKAGGEDKAAPRVLTMANPNCDRPPQLASWAEEVSRLSGGTLTIEFKNCWRKGEPRYEAGTLEDVTAGKVDIAWVGARAFDTVGVTSFQALVAPLLVDSYDLEAKVFEEGIPERMLEGVGELDLVGIGVLPGPMRKLLGVSKPFVRPGDFAGQVVGLQDSAVADMTLRALGATPRAVPSSAKLNGLDAYEQQLAAIASNNYDRRAKYVTANVNLWPRPLVIVMSKKAFASLTDEQQSALRDAAAAAIPEALEASRAEDEEAAPSLCRRGMTFAAASERELAELRTALERVYAALIADPQTKSHIDAVTNLKTELAASAEAPACTSTESPTTASPIPEGSYETTLTKADWLKGGVSEEDASQAAGVFTMTFAAGELTILEPNGEIGFRASYTVFRDQIEARESEDFTLTARWSLDGNKLTFTDIRPRPGPNEPRFFDVTWTSHPWVKTG